MQTAIDLKIHYVVDQPKVEILKKLHISNALRDNRHLLILVATTQLCKEL